MKAVNFTSWFGKTSVLSLLMLAACFAAVVIEGGPKLGVEFTGGTEVQIKVDSSTAREPEVREMFSGSGYKPVSVQRFGLETSGEFLVKFSTEILPPDEINNFKKSFASAVEKVPAFRGSEVLRIDYIGPNVGREFVRKAVFAVLIGCAAILMYLIFRFEIGYATGAVAALLHDVFITMGALAIADKEITLSIVAALLMVIGYSVNDTIVIFDRIRETVAGEDKPVEFTSSVNLGITRTLSRTVLTTITVFIVLVPLFILGGSVIHDFAFTLMVGVVAGTYSSIFVAPWFLVRMKKDGAAK